MPEAQPYGYWTYGKRNGLSGAASTFTVLPDGRPFTTKDSQHPAVLDDAFILWAVRNDKNALRSFFQLLPKMDPVSQKRLNDLVAKHPDYFIVRTDPSVLSDNIQRKQVTAGVRIKKT